MIYSTKRFSSHREYDLQEALKTRPDLDLSKYQDKELRKEIEDELIRQTRSKNPGVTQERGVKKNKPTGTKPVSWENRGKWKPTPERKNEIKQRKLLNEKLKNSRESIAKHEEKANKLRKLKYKRQTAGKIALGTAVGIGLAYGGKKLYDKNKEDKELKKYREQLGIIDTKRFSSNFNWVRGYKINPNLIREAEKTYNIKLPEDYKRTVLQNNNARPGVSSVFDTKNSKEHVFKKLLSLNKSDLETIYNSHPYGTNLYPFGIDPAGNLLCFDKFGVVWYWLHETDTKEKVANSFTDFINGFYK